MGTQFTDAILNDALIDVVDEGGRRASISFEDNMIIFHNRRPRQGKKVAIPLGKLLDLALKENPEFFDFSGRKKN